ncbi:hypothetical protein [Polaribacter sargassicola]|uniref:hypothetical protein n=1 Tax=Polaribacter sargassicola TaxID=2836891 RepID=UPI001F1B4752|nr:hypothetical protein [Polaribacter sp. DS7-9]MCG1037714.1 hypothetical protein [Polaribacter sp. DS7-9]
MESIVFEKIHNVIIDFLGEEKNDKLEIIGSWYFRFLCSENHKFNLYLPYYDKDFSSLAFNYIRAFTFVFNLLKEKKLTEYSGTCLFDIFKPMQNNQMADLTLNYKKVKNDVIVWGKAETLTKLDAFLPVFDEEELIRVNNPKTIRNTFKLFKSIRNYRLIDYPQLIEIEDKILSFSRGGNVNDEIISEKKIYIENVLDDDSAMDIEDELLEKKIKNSLLIKYPYSKNPHPYLIDVAKKKFNLIFNNRFVYNEISENDLFLLFNENNIASNLKYNVIDTRHSKNLYDSFKSFKSDWTSLELNKFTTPFPKYWLLFVNKSLTKDQWLEQFKKDFPAVAERPIINTVEIIIEELVKLNWIENSFTNEPKILFPELKSNRKKRLESIFNNFKNYVSSINPKIEFINSIEESDYKDVTVLDSFNIIDLVNKNQNAKNNINIVVPDFLYYGYQPWIKFHLFNYQSAPLLSKIREELDDNYSENKDKLEQLKTKIIGEIKNDLKVYRDNYKEDILEEIEDETIPDEEDLEYTNTEETENHDNEVEKENYCILINENAANRFEVVSTQKVLLQKDSLLYIKAAALKIGDFIITDSNISDLYKSDKLYDKLVSIPENVLNYQNQLNKRSNVYQALKRKGISYQHQNYFDNNYLLAPGKEHNFRIPRRKKDWEIICEYLNINHSDQQLSFIAYYGRSKQNDLKQLYKSIINLLIENNWLGTIENPVIINSVSTILNQESEIFKSTNEDEITNIAESIISTIISQLTFIEIKTIKTLKNE